MCSTRPASDTHRAVGADGGGLPQTRPGGSHRSMCSTTPNTPGSINGATGRVDPARPPSGVDPGDIRRTGGPRARSVGADFEGDSMTYRNWIEPRTGWHAVWPAGARGRVRVWRCFSSVRPRRLWRLWRP